MPPPKILIVDSDPEAAGALGSFLYSRGYSVLQAADGEAGLRLFRAERPQLIVTETILPLLHGFELCARIRKDPDPAPVIILSEACEDESFRGEAKRVFGASAYLVKPFDGERLLAEIKCALAAPAAEVVHEQERPGVEDVPKPGGPPAAPARKARLLDDLDALLDEALAEAGLDLKAKDIRVNAAHPPPPPPEDPPPAAPLTLEMSESVLDELLSRGRAVPPPGPPEAAAVASPPAPNGLADKGPVRKKPRRRRAVAAAAFLIIASALVFIFAAKKPPAPAVIPPAANAVETPEKEARPEETAVVKAEGPPSAVVREVEQAVERQESVLAPLLPAEKPPAKFDLPAVRPPAESPPSRPSPADVLESREAAGPAAAKTAPGDLIDLAAADVPPQLISSVEPVYPSLARERRQEGQVSLQALISERGEVRDVRLVKGPGGGLGFEAAARKAVLKWRYKPAEKNGVPVRVWKSVVVTFKIPRSEP